MKVCSRCKVEKQLEFFAKSGKNKGGRQGWCRVCVNECRRKPKMPKEIIEKQKKIKRIINLQKKRDYYIKNKDAHRKKMAENYLLNSEKYKAKSLKWKIDNKSRVNSTNMARIISKRRACPIWLSQDDKWMIEQAYELAKIRERICGGKWHVDHVVPLQGKTVSGLHVPWNLQVIPASLNCSKKNSWN